MKYSAFIVALFGVICVDLSDDVCAAVGVTPLLTTSASAQVFEEQLSSGSSSGMKSFRRGVRKISRTVVGSLDRWQEWLPSILAVAIMLLVVPAVDRGLLATLRDDGWTAARASLALGIAVYLRLVLDRRSPLLGKLLLVFAVIYGVSNRELLPDSLWPVGLLDDFVAIALTSRAFLGMCPDSLIQEHAKQAARRRDWSLRRRSNS